MSGKRAKEKKREADSPFAKLRPLRDALAEEKKEKAAKRADAEPTKTAGPVRDLPPKKATRGAPPPSPVTQAEADDDYRRLIAGAVPLDGRDRRVPRAENVPSRALPPESTAERDAALRYRALVDDAVAFEAVRRGGRVEAARRGLSNDTKKRLREGAFPVDASVDLHGLVATVARERLGEFLRAAARRRERCVSVVHGRGAHSQGGIAVLQDEVFHWLTGDFRGLVEATITAPISLGGEGATLVLLAKK